VGQGVCCTVTEGIADGSIGHAGHEAHGYQGTQEQQRQQSRCNPESPTTGQAYCAIHTPNLSQGRCSGNAGDRVVVLSR